MTSPTQRRLAPRQLFVIASLAVIAITAYVDRGFFDLEPFRFLRMFGLEGPAFVDSPPFPEDDHAAPTEEVAGVQDLRRALDGVIVARRILDKAVSSDPDDELWNVDSPTPEALARYWARRDAAWPAYAQAVEDCLVSARTARTLDPENGVFEVMEGLLELNLAIRPCPADSIFWADTDMDAAAQRITVVDAKRLEHALQIIERGLERETFTFRSGTLARGRIAEVEGRSLGGMMRRFAASATLMMPELMLTKAGCDALVKLARRERLSGRDAMPRLRLARKIALREGAQATTLIELLVADAMLRRVDDTWITEAAHVGDAEAAHKAHQELLAVRIRRAKARSLRGVDVNRLGTIDSLMMPAGGWGRGGDLSTGRRMDYAFVESAILWGLMLLAGVLLLLSALNARRAPSAEVPRAQGWTLGDLLGVVLPSFAGFAVLALLFSRLHPVREFGMMSSPSALGLQVLCVLYGGWFTYGYRLRAKVLAKHGLGLKRPRAARAAAIALSGGVGVGLFWVGPHALSLMPLSLGLLGASFCLALAGGVWGSPLSGPSRSSVLRYQGRVGIACAAAALCLLGALETTAVTGRREALIERSEHLSLERFLGEAENWGAGQPIEAFRLKLVYAPDAPAEER